MAYIGNTPAEKYISLSTQHFSVSATASYTLTSSVTNEDEIALFINNVRQEPGSSYAYTATGTALTLSEATAGTDTMYCVYLGKARETVTPPADSVDGTKITDNAVDSEHYVDGSIDEAHIATDAVNFATHLKAGTDGELITWDASGDPAAVAVGTATHVLTSNGAGAAPTFQAASGGDLRNFIIDGDFTQWPEGTSARTMTGSLYASALFQGNESTGGTATMERSTDVPTVGESNHSSKYSALFKCTGTDASIAAGDLMLVRHFISGSDYAYLHGAQVITVSFWCKTASANNGDTYSLHLQNYGEGRSYVTDFTATSSWSKITKTITTDNSGTWLFSEADMGMKVGIGLVAGTNFQGTADSWEGANDLGTSSTSNFMDSTSNEFYISQLSLVKGSSAPSSFLGEPISEVEDQVRYYVQTSFNSDIATGTGSEYGMWGQLDAGDYASAPTTSDDIRISCPLRTMRDTPSVTLYDMAGTAGKCSYYANTGGSTGNGAAATVDFIGHNNFRGKTSHSASKYGILFHYLADARH